VMMLEHLGLPGEADRLFAAIRAVIRDGEVTRDMGGNLGTAEVGARLVRHMQNAD